MKKFLSSLALLALLSVQVPASLALEASELPFSDIDRDDSAIQAISYLEENGIVSGYPDGTFQSLNKINRAEFTKILVESIGNASMNFSSNNESCFPDVPAGLWFSPYVCSAKNAGLVQGYPDGNFYPERDINFAEASKIISIGLELDVSENEENPEWYAPFVSALTDKNAVPLSISGSDKSIARGEMSEVMWRVLDQQNELPSQNFDELEGRLSQMESCEAFHDRFLNSPMPFPYYDGFYDFTGAEITESAMDAGAAAPASLAPQARDEDDFSTTNLQEVGVDEADIVKTNGSEIYYLQDGRVQAIQATPGNNMKLLNQIEFEDDTFNPSDLYLDGDTLIVLGYNNQNYYWERSGEIGIYPIYPGFFESQSSVYIYDVSNPENPELSRQLSFDGNLNTSRKIDNTLYLVINDYDNYLTEEVAVEDTENYLPRYRDVLEGTDEVLTPCDQVYVLPRNHSLSYISTAAIPLDGGPIDGDVIMGNSENVYASSKNLYISSTNYMGGDYYLDYNHARTQVHKLSLFPSEIDYYGSGYVPGTVLNQFSFSEYDHHLRIATTKRGNWWEDTEQETQLHILDDRMELVGSITGIAPTENLHSSRFMGKRGYLVTFKKVDPLFVLNLSDPNNPFIEGELKVPGYSDYLHFYDENHLIGFGKDATEASEEAIEARNLDFAWYQGLKMSLFDVTDPENPSQLYSVGMGDRGSESPVLWNHKALLFSKDKELLALPLVLTEREEGARDSDFGEPIFQGAQVYNLNLEDGFELRGQVTHFPEDYDSYISNYNNLAISRTLYIGDTLYALSDDQISAHNLQNLEQLDSLNFD